MSLPVVLAAAVLPRTMVFPLPSTTTTPMASTQPNISFSNLSIREFSSSRRPITTPTVFQTPRRPLISMIDADNEVSSTRIQSAPASSSADSHVFILVIAIVSPISIALVGVYFCFYRNTNAISRFEAASSSRHTDSPITTAIPLSSECTSLSLCNHTTISVSRIDPKVSGRMERVPSRHCSHVFKAL